MHRGNDDRRRVEQGGRILRTLFVKIVMIVIVFLSIGFNPNIRQQSTKEGLVKSNSATPVKMKEVIAQNKENQSVRVNLAMPKEGLSLLIGKTAQELEKELGKPQRIDPSAYGYDWYIYNHDVCHYVQVGVDQNHVTAVYAIGDDLNVAPFEIGQSIEEVLNIQSVVKNVDIHINGNYYQMKLKNSDIYLCPLFKMGGIYVQLYFDRFTGELSSVRYLDAMTLIKQRPYELVCQGDLLNAPKLTPALRKNAESAAAMEIFDLTNVLRKRYGKKPLQWDNKTAAVALEHSVEMYKSKKRSHVLKKYGSLSTRLKAVNIHFLSAGENTAENYPDGPAVVAGWLNSKSHRAFLLNKYFTHVGAGVYQNGYTEVFLQKLLKNQ